MLGERRLHTGKYTDGCPCFHTHLQRMRRVALKEDRKRKSESQPPAKSGQKPSGQTTKEARPRLHQRSKHQRQQNKPLQQEQQKKKQRRKPWKLPQTQGPQPQSQQPQPQPHQPVSYAAAAAANPHPSTASPTAAFNVDAATIMELLVILQQRQQQLQQAAPPAQPLQLHQPLHVLQPSWPGTQAQAAY